MRMDKQNKRYVDGGSRGLRKGLERRIYVVAFGLLVAFSILGIRLWYLQIVQWYEYVQVAESNRLHPQRLEAPRGMIYGPDTSVVLADNRPSCDLVIVPAECDPDAVDGVCRRLEELVGADGDAIRQQILESKKPTRADNKNAPYRQILVKQDVSKDDLIRVEEFSYCLPGVFAVAQPQRRYLYGKTAGQILGYLGEIGPDEVGQLEGYQGGDMIGRDGLEQMYESTLRGTDGQLVVQVYASDGWPQLRTDRHGQPMLTVDQHGRKLLEEKKFRRDAVSGKSLFVTLDIDLQRHCEELLEGKVGAIVVLNADTGAALTLASSPGYDPSIFVTHGRNRERNEALRGKPNPMLNRCYREVYAPGSVFKILLAAAALEEGVIDANTSFYCPGFFQLEGQKDKKYCWKRVGHGRISVVDALAFSCDVFFYNVGLRLGVDNISKWSQIMGLGAKTGIDLPQEVKGLVPSREWKEAKLRPEHPDEPWVYRWYPGETLNLAIGQGETTTTPLQIAVMMASIVNGGRHVRPYVNRDLGPKVSEPFLREQTLEIIRKGMRKCVDKDPPAPTGTGNAAKIPGMVVIGKTGSAQMVSLDRHKEYEKEEDIPYNLRDHAWFTCGVLDREPRIAVCVLVEHGHHGSSAAAPLAKDTIEYFYSSGAGRPRQPLDTPEINLAQEGPVD